jgi:hypothetical protein
MKPLANPALKAFLQALGDGMAVAQVRVCRVPGGFELCHVADANAAPERLRDLSPAQLRALAQADAAGGFRPLHASPDLVSGWRCLAPGESELETALQLLYPGFIADWWATQQEPVPVTHYREFTARQSGMYRITAMLDDSAAARMVSACCDARFCLKRRLWTTPGLAPDPSDAKSLIPCLEPCAVLLEFARKAMRIEQEPKAAHSLAPSDLAAIRAALEIRAGGPVTESRAADFSDPANPRRARLALEKLRGVEPAKTEEKA